MEQTENKSNPSGRSTSVISKLGSIVLLSSCFVLGSLLIVTFGVSCTALYYAINKRFKENSGKVKDRVAKDPTLEYMLALPEIDDTMVQSATEMIESIHTVRALDRTVFLIVSEEAAAYFSGQISLDTAVNNIQNRTATVVKERG